MVMTGFGGLDMPLKHVSETSTLSILTRPLMTRDEKAFNGCEGKHQVIVDYLSILVKLSYFEHLWLHCVPKGLIESRTVGIKCEKEC
jgi:hypothetical protein